MKKYFIITILLLNMLWFNSCEDYLDLPPDSQLSVDNFYRNDKEVESGVLALYAGIHSYVNYEWQVTELRSDNGKCREGRSEGERREFETMDVKTTNSVVASYWSDNYNVIFRANVVLENIKNVSNASLKQQYEGEARFARAFCYFNLVRAFGDVPLVDRVIESTETEYFARKPQSDVYNFIVTDLLSAIDMLPRKSGIAFGRATKGAAQALLAKAYLTLKDYSNAKTLLEQVISSGDYALRPILRDVFYTERNNEIIFAAEYIADIAGESFSNSFTEGGLNNITDNLINTVDPTDLRKPTLFFWNPKAGSMGAWEIGKYQPIGVAASQGIDWIIIRYADVLLMHAEAILGANASTTDASALASFTAIRTRAGLGTVAILTKDLLLNERRIELCSENQRLYDLIRFGVAETVMEAFSLTPEADFEFKSTALLLPIPMREINIYDGLIQNPGYGY